jgi:hypothetical protein
MDRPASLRRAVFYAGLCSQVTAPASGNTPAQPRLRHNSDISTIVERNPRVHGEPQVVIVPLQQAAGEGGVSFLQVGGAGRGRLHAEAGGRPEGVLGLEHPGWIDAVQVAVAGERGVCRFKMS